MASLSSTYLKNFRKCIMDGDFERINLGLISVSRIVILHNAFKSWNKRLCEHDCNDLCVFVRMCVTDRKTERKQNRERDRERESKYAIH